MHDKENCPDEIIEQLELDKATLIEALEHVVNQMQDVWDDARAALRAARKSTR